MLAAANPVYGRYDDYKSAAENIDFLPTILSRFDLIFIVRDIRDEERDRSIARHVLSVHINASRAAGGSRNKGRGGVMGSLTGASGLMGDGSRLDENGNRNDDGDDDDGLDISIATMKRYISYCRARCAPTLSEEATLMLRSHYVSIRNDQRQRSMQEGASNAAVPITVRQLAEQIADEYGKRSLLRFGARPDNQIDPPCVLGVPNFK